MKIFISGGSGFIGKNLVNCFLNGGSKVVATGTSNAYKNFSHENFLYLRADTTQRGGWQDELKDSDVIINLAGRSIFGYWTKKYKKELYESRILSTKNIVSAISGKKPVILLSASATGYYGNRNDDRLDENQPKGDDFLSHLAYDWENKAVKAEEKGARVVLLRFGVVLGKDGGAMKKMLPAFKAGAGGPLGDGNQWFPWIHIDDLISALIFLIKNKGIKGPVNFVAPDIVRNKDFAVALGKVLGRPAKLPMPGILLKTLGGELGKLLMASQRAIPSVLSTAGFKYKFPNLEMAINNIVK